MGEVSNPSGVSASVFQALSDSYDAFVTAVDGRINAILDRISASAFVSTTPVSLSGLLASYPPSADNVGKYARVTDLYGSVDEVMRCRWDGIAYRWVPQRESFTGNNAAVTGAVNIMPLVTPPVLDFTGTLTGNLTVTISPINAYIGMSQLVRARGVMGILNINITGLIGGGSVPLLTGADRTLIYTAAGWKG